MVPPPSSATCRQGLHVERDTAGGEAAAQLTVRSVLFFVASSSNVSRVIFTSPLSFCSCRRSSDCAFTSFCLSASFLLLSSAAASVLTRSYR